MAILKCKMCGGRLEVKPGDTVAECPYCGTLQTLPKLDNEKKNNLYDRASHYRLNSDFDKALSIYEQVLSEDETDAESYWSIVLCRYGIEYVEDPRTHQRIPTVNRTQTTSVFNDPDYLNALKYADEKQKAVYESEAHKIDAIQKRILQISRKEQPYDVFICYKETDNDGKRTPDSVYAMEIYNALTKEGYKVFFSRITLEDKLGQEYEPYIYAALNSSKVMVVVGTRQEYFNAVWVKNEWSRYLTMIRNGEDKTLIPAYKDIDPYDLPEEFSYLQALNMGQIGFMQDLVHGIEKLIPKKNAEVSTDKPSTNLNALSKRVFILIEDGSTEQAGQICEEILNSDPENAYAYLGKLMIEKGVRKLDELGDLKASFTEDPNFHRAVKYADSKLQTKLNQLAENVDNNIKEEQQEKAYQAAEELLNSASDEQSFNSAAEAFENIGNYKDAVQLTSKCRILAENERKEKVYQNALELIRKNNSTDSAKAVQLLKSLANYKDVLALIDKTNSEIPHQKKTESRRKKRTIKICIISVATIVIALLSYYVIYPQLLLHKAKEDYNAGNYDEAIVLYEKIGDNESVTASMYQKGITLLENGNYDAAIDLFKQLTKYKDADNNLKKAYYLKGKNLLSKQKYNDAIQALINSKGYEDSQDLLRDAYYNSGKIALDQKNYDDAFTNLTRAGNYKNAKDLLVQANYEEGCLNMEKGNYQNAERNFAAVKDYKDSRDKWQEAVYMEGSEAFDSHNWQDAVTNFTRITEYKDAADLMYQAEYSYVQANKTNDDFTTFYYLRSLKNHGYKDAASIYSDLYKWKVTFYAVNNDPDSDDNMNSISKYDPVYFHYRISGGVPESSTVFSFVYRLPDGDTGKYTDESESYATFSNYTRWYGWSEGIYNNPAYGSAGTLTVTAYDGDGNNVGQGSVYITD